MTTETFLTDSEARFPMPKGEMDRLRARRWILRHLPTGGVGVEVGVFRGHFSALICEVAAPRKLYLIDPWTTLGATFGWGKEYTAFGTLPTATARDEALARTARFPQVETVLVESIYPDCADRIEEPLDFAYLDASHKYLPTLTELRALTLQVRPGGIIAGDDWSPNPDSPHHGVYLAVQDFVRESEWEVLVAGPAGQWALRRRAR